MNNKSKCLSSLIFGTIFLIMTFANYFTASAEGSSVVIVKEIPEQTGKPVVRPSRKKSETKYNVEVGPVKIIKPKTQNKPPDNRTHGTKGTISSSNGNGTKFKTDIKIKPIKKMGSVAPKTRERRQINQVEKRDENEIYKIQIGPIKAIEKEGVSQEGRDEKYKVNVGPVKPIIEDESATNVRSPISERVKVIRVQSWKLDKSGNKTNEPSIENMRVIEGVNQPPADLNNGKK